ncbi:hypothetical protein DFH28DRAFT_920988 [Melampsora americana]|nr:hypothetical protein DFH28DRAFT_920988 [Melampsora americana]
MSPRQICTGYKNVGQIMILAFNLSPTTTTTTIKTPTTTNITTFASSSIEAHPSIMLGFLLKLTKTFNTNIPKTQAQFPNISNKSNNVKSNRITGFFLDCGSLLDVPGSEDFVWRRSFKRLRYVSFSGEIQGPNTSLHMDPLALDNHLIHPLSCSIFEKKYIHMNPSLFGEDH